MSYLDILKESYLVKRGKKLIKENNYELQSKIIKFITDNPNPNDDVVHEFAKSNNINPVDLENEIYALLTTLLKDVGKHKNISDSKYDPKELKMGIEVEKEHTDNEAIAKEIAKDHLTEIPGTGKGDGYYSLLNKMEKDAGIEG